MQGDKNFLKSVANIPIQAKSYLPKSLFSRWGESIRSHGGRSASTGRVVIRGFGRFKKSKHSDRRHAMRPDFHDILHREVYISRFERIFGKSYSIGSCVRLRGGICVFAPIRLGLHVGAIRTPASYERRDWGDVPIEKQFDSIAMLGLGVYVRRLIGSGGSIIANARGSKALIAFFVSGIAILVAPSGALLFLSSGVIAYEALGCASHYAQPLAIKGRI